MGLRERGHRTPGPCQADTSPAGRPAYVEATGRPSGEGPDGHGDPPAAEFQAIPLVWRRLAALALIAGGMPPDPRQGAAFTCVVRRVRDVADSTFARRRPCQAHPGPPATA